MREGRARASRAAAGVPMEAMLDAMQFLRECGDWTEEQRGAVERFVVEAADGSARAGGEGERTWERMRGALFVLMGRGDTPRLVPAALGRPFERLGDTLIVNGERAGYRQAGAVAVRPLTLNGHPSPRRAPSAMAPDEFVQLGREMVDASAQLHSRLVDCATVYTLADACSTEAPQWAVRVCTEVRALRKAIAAAPSGTAAPSGAQAYPVPEDAQGFEM